jgi:hypothetical protein
MYSHALRNAEQSNVSNILLLYAMLRYLIFHVLRYAEISDFRFVSFLSLHILFRFDSQFTDFVSFRRISFRLVVFRFVSSKMYFTLTLYISFGKSRVHSQIKINTARYLLNV